MRIGLVANQVALTVETIRFYEKNGLIEPPERNESGYRDYPEATVQQLSFIRKAKELGFSLKEIKELLLLRNAPGSTCHEVKEQAVKKMQDIDCKVNELLDIKKSLAQLVSSCPGQGPLSGCPLIKSISTQKIDE